MENKHEKDAKICIHVFVLTYPQVIILYLYDSTFDIRKENVS